MFLRKTNSTITLSTKIDVFRSKTDDKSIVGESPKHPNRTCESISKNTARKCKRIVLVVHEGIVDRDIVFESIVLHVVL